MVKHDIIIIFYGKTTYNLFEQTGIEKFYIKVTF